MNRLQAKPISYKAIWLATSLVPLCLNTSGCGSSSQAAKAAQNLEGAALGFGGLEELTIQPDRSWALRWEPANANGVIYGVYRAPKGEAFDFLTPELSTYETMYRFYSEDLLNATPQCFVVRVLNGNIDQNEQSLCTDDQPLKFSGIESINRLDSGRYNLTWEALPIPGTSYLVYERDENNEFNFDQPSYGGIRENFFLTDIAPRGKVYCFVARYYNPDLAVDTNTNELCTLYEEPLVFDGIKNLIVIDNTRVKVMWDLPESQPDITGFQIFVGSDFSEFVGTAEPDATEFIVSGLAPKRQYSFGVSAVDAFNRQDENIKILPIVMPEIVMPE